MAGEFTNNGSGDVFALCNYKQAGIMFAETGEKFVLSAAVCDLLRQSYVQINPS